MTIKFVGETFLGLYVSHEMKIGTSRAQNTVLKIVGSVNELLDVVVCATNLCISVIASEVMAALCIVCAAETQEHTSTKDFELCRCLVRGPSSNSLLGRTV